MFSLKGQVESPSSLYSKEHDWTRWGGG